MFQGFLQWLGWPKSWPGCQRSPNCPQAPPGNDRPNLRWPLLNNPPALLVSLLLFFTVFKKLAVLSFIQFDTLLCQSNQLSNTSLAHSLTTTASYDQPLEIQSIIPISEYLTVIIISENALLNHRDCFGCHVHWRSRSWTYSRSPTQTWEEGVRISLRWM